LFSGTFFSLIDHKAFNVAKSMLGLSDLLKKFHKHFVQVHEKWFQSFSKLSILPECFQLSITFNMYGISLERQEAQSVLTDDVLK
jgi:hypothetical protein